MTVKRGIDHLVVCVNDLDLCADFYRDLGFTTTPRARHPWGTDNYLVQLSGSFIELLTVSRPSLISENSSKTFSFGAFNQKFLTRREGMSMLVFESKDAEADREEFMARGLPPYDKFYFERQAKLPDGSQVPVAFSLAFATDPRMPQAAFFCCQQHAPQYFWKAEYQSHANGAERILEVIMVANEPETFAGFFSKLQEPECVVKKGTELIIQTPRGTIRVLTPAEAQVRYEIGSLDVFPETPYFLGFAVQVGDLELLCDYFNNNSIPCKLSNGFIGVLPKDAFGVLIEFRK
jgi:catechol 2,3-dioxygenase-like lactoylglutathione lyase family enzyme